MDIKSTITLNNGVSVPAFGLGVYQLHPGCETRRAVNWALDAGYRHIDTATLYYNEADVGAGIAESNLSRDEIFITSKLMNEDHDNPAAAMQLSLEKLQVDSVDLYLMHWPVSGLRLKTWAVLEDLYSQGLCKAIGVCNFTSRHLHELLKNCSIKPAINQVEFNPFLNQKELLAYCIRENIQLEAYSPLARGNMLDDARIENIAIKYQKTTAQIMIRWSLQHQLVVIPKSKNKTRICENADVFDFEISEKDMEYLNGFDDNLRFCWNPSLES